ncbi:MAG: hypothetical protein LBQ54_01465 [Planctomycetaceae bacterium]|jgi:hypothetical protein|nr:hypothetical protein [Planctomycetaceae bacterium]
MKIRDFFEHYGIIGNPFSEEDAQKDQVFQEHCIETTFHPAWDKLYGNPEEPDTSLIFGEKGSGKTALRYQMVKALDKFNRKHKDSHPLVIEYANWNPFLDRFRARFSAKRKNEQVLSRWQLWDHIDAILSLGVTQIVDRILIPDEVDYPATADKTKVDARSLSHHKKRDLLTLETFYDQPKGDDLLIRWKQLSRKIGFSTWKYCGQVWWPFLLGIVLTLFFGFLMLRFGKSGDFLNQVCPWLMIAGWCPWIGKLVCRGWKSFWVVRRVRILKGDTKTTLKRLLRFNVVDYSGISFPTRRSTDTRYELLNRYLDILESLGFHGVIVLIDQVDEPYLISGSPELMQKVLWPLFDNKLLKYPGMGFKLLLPIELLRFLEREDAAFHQRARIDKQNLVRSLDWTGLSLYDLANDRLRCCRSDAGHKITIEDFFEPAVGKRRLESAFEQLRVPRHLFKFLYRTIMSHGNAHSDGEPVWVISAARFETELALYLNDRRASERNVSII